MAARKKTTKGPKPVEATVHKDTRANLPTADAQEFVSPEVEEVRTLQYPRDPGLDPQLVWKGKDELDGEDLEVEAPPIYIQEKIDPRVLVENLRKTAAEGEREPELSLFESFDGLGEFEIVDFYRHQANWSNRMILGDSLQVMASLAERESLRGQVQMIYMDPPYGIRFGSNWQVSARKRDVRDGKLEDASREVEMIKAFRDTWELGIHSYLTYMRDRLMVARDLLTESGSVFVQIGDENVHLVRSLLDEVFGSENFVSQIAFQKTTSSSTGNLGAVADYILWYAREAEVVKVRALYVEKVLGESGATGYTRVELPDGSERPLTNIEIADPGSLPAGSRVFANDNITSQRPAQSGDLRSFEYQGKTFSPGAGTFKTNAQGMERLAAAGRLAVSTRGSLAYRRYFDDFPAFPLNNVWTDTVGQNQFGGTKVYVVQTAIKVVQRCVLMATDPGDLVLDPTSGSGTTAYVAEQWGRRWIAIDTSRVANALARQRLMAARLPYYILADTEQGVKKERELSGIAVDLGSVTGDVSRGFVSRRVPHVTLSSIASNPDIHARMSKEEIDAVVDRSTSFESLHDRPYEDNSRVRVAGPFTTESLSPHRSLAFTPADGEPEVSLSEVTADQSTSAESFGQTVLDNLLKAGIQNGRRNERLEFSVVDSYAGDHIQAKGTYKTGEVEKRVGIAIGPQYGTVGPSFIKAAAKEAINAADIDLLAVLGFAFDPTAIESTDDYVSSDERFDVAAERSLGKVPVLLVRMNADLVMGEDLKKTGSGNLFTVFGEPDIEIDEQGDELVVKLNGVDVYNPTTGEVRSSDTDQIAMWMIDTDYNEESFFVRHAYFTGGNDPYKRLKTALKADIDEEAWSTLYRTESRPFPRPSNGKIAVKVINDYGDEVMKIFDVEVALSARRK